MTVSTRREPPGADELLTIVQEAWRSLLPDATDPDLSWEESGGDSLATLQLLLRLEKRLGRKLSFDLLAADMTAIDIARALAIVETAAPTARGPNLFLLPGLFGDEPILADFRRAFTGSVRFEIVEHLGLASRTRVLRDAEAEGAAAAAEIARRQPDGDVFLAGYSFGGKIAFEAAHHLQAEGRRVAWLGILDTGFASLAASKLAAPTRVDKMDSMVKAGVNDAVRTLMLTAVRRFWPDRLVELRQRMLLHFRTRINVEWRPRPLLDVAGLLVLSQERTAAMEARWSALCPGARVVRLPVGHRALFQPASLAQLTPIFARSVADAAALGARGGPEAPKDPSTSKTIVHAG